MEESNDERGVVPELYFLIAKFLSGGPLKETAKTLLRELQSVEILPRRLDWEGNEHAQSYDELAAQYAEVSWRRLAAVCERALTLVPSPSLPSPPPPDAVLVPTPAIAPTSAPAPAPLRPRLSLLSESLVRPKPKYASFKRDQSVVRRLVSRELGCVSSPGRPDRSLFPARLLSGLQLQRRTLGHLSAVYCLVFDCTGDYIITGADDLLIKVWSATMGRLVATLRGAGAEITDVCVSRDGALLAAGSVERLVRVWCLATGAPRAVLHAHQGTITSVHWSPRCGAEVRWLASTSTDGSVAFWACADGQFLSQPVQYVERMRPGACHMICAAWSAGGTLLAAGSADHHVRLYAMDGPTGPRRVLETAVHADAVDSIAWAHRGLRFLSGSKDGTAALWTLHATQWRHHILRADTDDKRLKVTMVCWDCSDSFVMTAVSDWSVRVWCARTYAPVRTLRGHRDEAYVLEPHPFLPAVFLSAGHDGQLFVWNAQDGEVIARFHNEIAGQGDGAIFDAKWGGGGSLVGASDSHGHLLLLGLSQGHPLLRRLPSELFFHTDYRPLARDALGGALDEQTEIPPHLMPPPFLVDVEGSPHPPEFQRLVPGREHLAPSQLVPAADARSRLDRMIEELAADRTPPPGGGGGANGAGGASGGGGVWRGEGVRHTGGRWHSEEEHVPTVTRPIVRQLSRAQVQRIEETSGEMFAWEQSWYRREMRRRPVMISTAGGDGGGVGGRRRVGRTSRAPRPRPTPRPPPRMSESAVERLEESMSGSASGVASDTSDESVRLSGRSTPRSQSRTSQELTQDDSSRSDSRSDDSTSSQYSDWEAGAALEPPARARRRPRPATRYSPSATRTRQRVSAAAGTGQQGGEREEQGGGDEEEGERKKVEELPEAYRPGEWLTAVSPRKAPYHPQMGDHCVYFRLGHQRYLEAVAEKDLYPVQPRDKPWDLMHIYDCELVKVVGIKYVIKPPRVVCLRLCGALPPPGGGSGGAKGAARTFTVRYHDMADVIDFLVLRQQYATAVARGWKQGDRFRCMIDDSWWTGVVLESGAPESGGGADGPMDEGESPSDWATAAAARFLSVRVRWDNGEVERLSPWDLEPIDPERLPLEPGGSVPVLPHELEAVLYRAEPAEWPPRGDRAAACRAIAHHINQVMSLSVAEPFLAPVDLQAYPSYAMLVPYPIDLATIRARFDNLWYRRAAAAQFDVRYVASNAERFNRAHSSIVRQARLLTDLLLHIVAHWRDVDVLKHYRDLAANYHSDTDKEQKEHNENQKKTTRTRNKPKRRGQGDGEGSAGGATWQEVCGGVLRELLASSDSGPFREPVSPEQAPDYHLVVSRPLDLGTVGSRLASGRYLRPEQFAQDVRTVFANSRQYNTNKRSRIYSMTVRLSSLFEALWSRAPLSRTSRTTRPSRKPRKHRPHADESLNGICDDAEASADADAEATAAAERLARDSWDSDTPLHHHRKGKGVGKKSKRNVEPKAGTSAARDDVWEGNGAHAEWNQELETSSDTSLGDLLRVRRRMRAGGGGTASREQRGTSRRRRARKRRRRTSESSANERWRPRNKRRGKRTTNPPKRIRERFEEVSSSSSSSWSDEGRGAGVGTGGSGRHYESDRSYRPRYSSDDDAPLHLYRQRQEESTRSASGSGRTHNGHSRSGEGGVSLRARSPRHYNEDSEDDSVAAISKRMRASHTHPLARLVHRHPQGMSSSGAGTGVAAGVAGSAHRDHTYVNGVAHAHTQLNGARGGAGGGESSAGSGGGGPVSISSRGRVRRLTAKARGLLQHRD